MSNWFSDEALRKQATLAVMPRDLINWSHVRGVWEPRTQPTADERCRCCGGDAREGAGGSGTHCGICVGRGHDEDTR
jgi:hypothetical protein